MNNKIDNLRKFFATTVAAFEFQHNIAVAFGCKELKHPIHNLHILAKEEINKENPDLNQIDILLAMMEDATENKTSDF